jgi:hypothetical protein
MSHTAERRRNTDRRQVDLGPPSGHEERRRQTERRHPELVEVGFDEWEALVAAREKEGLTRSAIFAITSDEASLRG